MDHETIKDAEAKIASVQAALDEAQRVLQAAERAQAAAERSEEAMRRVASFAVAGLVAISLAVALGRRRANR